MNLLTICLKNIWHRKIGMGLTVLGVGVSVAAFLIVILGIVNTMTTSLLERTREIGILLAMGWRNTRIIGLVLYESILSLMESRLKKEERYENKVYRTTVVSCER